ncbi:hypothetical protein QYF36_010227 [Acer negundo]|nr:hypothetical protein QYF36_010227 [Acer negundo]
MEELRDVGELVGFGKGWNGNGEGNAVEMREFDNTEKKLLYDGYWVAFEWRRENKAMISCLSKKLILDLNVTTLGLHSSLSKYYN